MSGRTIARVIIVVLAGIALGGVVTLVAGPRLLLPPLPPPPAIDAPRGDAPTGVVAFEERVRQGDAYMLSGSGFLLELPGGQVAGVTTAHSLGEGNFAPMVFTIAGESAPVATFDELLAPLGRPRAGDDLTIDYVLMRPSSPPDPARVLLPDPRGAPQPGERVSLYSGLGDGRGQPRILHGTVESVDANGAWLRMDDLFDPGLMSGSPIISQHTGRVVGMTIAVWLRPGALSIGVHPIGSILEKAASR